ncbi:nitrite reductase [Brevibacillus agri]|uniref:Nitrite reductase n=1 Tax=Brevibacillus gelatini TaxID=1655277 RepID=A0A3M8B3B2_9BACL|nr:MULTISPECIES: nitrite reductase [Brevibacillus]MBG9565375.1 nitrite reductase [Brevibacillus agri]MED4569593.1 nitrite reductase [Brevibacillus agri]RNB57929.1 nitrite reductase [Brevibacillus gelatini]
MNRVKFAVSPEIRVGGAVFTPKDMVAIGEIVGEDAQIELTTFQQLIVEMSEEKADEAKQALRDFGLCVYEVGSVVKNLSVCTFCKGAEVEGLQAARDLNETIAGMPVPFTMRVGYTGCPNACGEPLVKDIGIVKRKDMFEIYIGGQSKSMEAKTADLLVDQVREEELSTVVKSVITLYQEKGKKREKFSKFVQRYGVDNIRKECGL